MTHYDHIKKQLNRHIASLLVDEDPLGLGRDLWRYRVSKYKQHHPEKFRRYETRITQDLLELQNEVRGFWLIRKQNNRK